MPGLYLYESGITKMSVERPLPNVLNGGVLGAGGRGVGRQVPGATSKQLFRSSRGAITRLRLRRGGMPLSVNVSC